MDSKCSRKHCFGAVGLRTPLPQKFAAYTFHALRDRTYGTESGSPAQATARKWDALIFTHGSVNWIVLHGPPIEMFALKCAPWVWQAAGYDVYVNEPQMLPEGQDKHIISVFVADESGMINRVAGVFARRGTSLSFRFLLSAQRSLSAF